MNLLLDTHAMLWFWLYKPSLSLTAANAIEDADLVFISPASYWELAIKIRLGQYTLPMDYTAFLQRQIALNDFNILPIELQHTAVLTSLPLHHRDPFDRLLVAQAMVENIPIVSGDSALDAYPVKRVW